MYMTGGGTTNILRMSYKYRPQYCLECSNNPTRGHIYDHVRMFSYSSDTRSDTSSRATSRATSFRTERSKQEKTCPAAEVAGIRRFFEKLSKPETSEEATPKKQYREEDFLSLVPI